MDFKLRQTLNGLALTKIPRGAGRKLVGNWVVGNTLNGVIVTVNHQAKK